ncbi:alpha/beta-hydrolase, partial [Calocera viscosa TUFC12733]
VHGIPFDSSYWDYPYEPETYSYVWAAAAAGYTTFRYDRLGTGLSDHPQDGVNVVQADTDVAILSSLASLLRAGGIGGVGYSKILLVGHSYGSVQATALVSRSPGSVDGLIATGFSSYGSFVPLFLASGLWSSAAQVAPYRYAALPSTYLLPAVPQASGMNFYYWPGYDPGLFALETASAQPVTVGVMFTLESVAAPAENFTGPVMLVTGAQDFPFCGGNCYSLQPSNLTILQETGSTLFPASKFSYYAPQETGHDVNLHLSAPGTYGVML